MWVAIRSTWPLLIGIGLLMVSNGLLSTLLTLKAGGLGFSESAIGFMQSGYPAGALLGCVVAPRLVARVGHIRVFAALASVASAATLVHLVTGDALSWGAMRLLSGFCFAGVYVVAEGWLNGRATNATRGSLLSIYFVIQTGGVSLGQTLLKLSTADSIALLVAASIMISVALVPILISTSPSPGFDVPRKVSFTRLFQLSPMGLSGCFLNGVAQGTIYVALALYGRAIGLDAGSIGILIGAATLGGMLLQFPMGRLSDRIDRRMVIVGAAGLAAPLCMAVAAIANPAADFLLLCVGVAIIGGLTLPVYSICVAHTNDYLAPDQIVAASGTLVLVLGSGMVLGPALGSLAVERYGPSGLFILLATVHGATVATALFRLWRGRSRPDIHITAVPIAHGATPVAARLNPEAEQGPAGNAETDQVPGR